MRTDEVLARLAFNDPGFDHTVLAEFRGRVAGAGLEQVVLDALLARLVGEGLVNAAASSVPIPPTWSPRWRR